MIPLRFYSASALALLLGFGATAHAFAADAIAVAARGPAPSLKSPTTPTAAPRADGFISRWLVLDPIPGDGRVNDSAIQAAAKKEYFPDQLTVLPHDGDKVTIGGADYVWHAIDSSKFNVNLYHLAFYNNKPTSNVVFWGVTVINCPREFADVRLLVGSNAGSVWWLNGQEVAGIYGDRQTVIDDGASKKLTLKKGPNILRCVVVNNAGMVDFCARFLDANDKPLTQFTMSLSAGGTKTP
jgi:hypothetical protein